MLAITTKARKVYWFRMSHYYLWMHSVLFFTVAMKNAPFQISNVTRSRQFIQNCVMLPSKHYLAPARCRLAPSSWLSKESRRRDKKERPPWPAPEKTGRVRRLIVFVFCLYVDGRPAGSRLTSRILGQSVTTKVLFSIRKISLMFWDTVQKWHGKESKERSSSFCWDGSDDINNVLVFSKSLI